ncbi:hypothetical protein ORIO_23230 (plasmid) [Cereibacter azotoformans]|uniref:Uncharacterized protein n=2 Tax=Cereibacter TaxID=1653176 RepID=A0A2T5JYN1_9RHOB|nr:hypothetical protein [Cereibacter azotoformans]AXQ94453.1 hypothetical protein D0Z66_11935 [Cereibacter sphaeroides]MBO4170712.1 hypothetical protein [Cereibacter azotoformans]PTR15284.1 hypothetical protein C8J28_1144 [Cereibacter azotoformans]UIJ30000.1 hypothetical protein LV780_11910 [Cereibacter azotoformans]ULB12677.1 hypothetical protein ORIO_23230 [Cereibacter azotoformans]
MSDPFKHHSSGLDSPALGALAVTPSDSADLATAIRAVTIGGGGTLAFVGVDGTTCTTGELPAGTYALRASSIRATGTTATDITGWI